MIVAQEFHMKIQGFTTQTRLESKRHGILREAKQKPSKCDQEEERSIGGWVRVVYRRLEEATNFILELEATIKIQAGG